jgi:hypothetical protein
VAPQLIEGERRRVLKFGPYVPNVAEEAFSEVRYPQATPSYGKDTPFGGCAITHKFGKMPACTGEQRKA